MHGVGDPCGTESSAAGIGAGESSEIELGENLRTRTDFPAQSATRAFHSFCDEGSALVETAIVLPLVLLILTAAASYAWSFYGLQELGNAVTAAAQAVGTNARSVSNPCSVVVTQVTATLPDWNASNLTYTVSFSNSSSNTTPTTPYSWTGSTAPTSCAAEGDMGSTPQMANTPISVTVQYNSTGLPIFQWLASWNINPLSNLSSSETTMAF